MHLFAEDRAHVDQILAVVVDAVAEGRLAFHPKSFYAVRMHVSHHVQARVFHSQQPEQAAAFLGSGECCASLLLPTRRSPAPSPPLCDHP